MQINSPNLFGSFRTNFQGRENQEQLKIQQGQANGASSPVQIQQ